MEAPTTCEAFLELVRQSGLVKRERLDAYVRRLADKGKLAGRAEKLAGRLVRDGLLTRLQKEQLLRGQAHGFTLGKYLLLERLGSRSSGTVRGLLAADPSRRRLVAVQVLPALEADGPSPPERFCAEAKAAAALKHPNLVRAYAIEQDGDRHFLVRKYVDGHGLLDIVLKRGPLAFPRAAHYLRQAAEGLQHVHDAGLTHRAIRPGNLLLDRRGRVKILDLGLAGFFKHHPAPARGEYRAPEQASAGDAVDIRADIYSLGATFFFLLTGRPPRGGERKPMRDLRPDVPEEFVAVLTRMTAEDPAQRYPTPAAVVEALAPYTRDPIPPPPDNDMPHLCPAARRPWILKDEAAEEPRDSTPVEMAAAEPRIQAAPPAEEAVPEKPTATVVRAAHTAPTPSRAAPRSRRNLLVLAGGVALVAVGCLAWLGIVTANRKEPEKPVELSAEQLLHEFRTNEVAANVKYVGKVVEIQGAVVKVTDDAVVVDVGKSGDGLFYCRIDGERDKEQASQLRKGDRLAVKGTCDGVTTFGRGVDLIKCDFRK
jgi:serine/threonine protein kinase